MAFKSGAFKRGAFLQKAPQKINIFNLSGLFMTDLAITAVYADELFSELRLYTGE
jgi:hypothetical protein